ncbi:Ger(x)C family spore germination protein [Alicyclobacillus mengziensis]|uniref:Ger(X)C family spore germination protein n=1 Tax=Alicyclobacillus mengziensis TaxID=2931921 RepID=A0A9X7VY45_9BACL|nr:Ger(x)C family spore germination protein [Alicyclobacillus mengziensis]
MYSFLVFGTAGCWSSRELNESALVAGAGFDRRDGKYQLTIQILQPGKLTPSTRGQSERAVYVSQDTGKTIFEAIRTFPHQTTRKLYWSHCQVFIVGREIAEESVTKTLNWFYRNQELRPLSYVAMSEGEASEILMTKTHLNPIPAYDIASDIKTLSDTSQAPTVTLKDFMKMTANPIGTAYMPVLNKMRIVGTAVFLHDRLAGELNWDESRGLLSLNGLVNSGKILVPSSTTVRTERTEQQDFSTFEIIHENVTRKVKFVQSKPIVSYHIRCTVDLADDPSLEQHSTSDVKKLEQEASERIKQQAEACIQKVKDWHADVIGAGEAIHRSRPREWQRLKDGWEQKFPSTSIEVTADVRVRHEGLIRGRM